jgi:hypothetical protein
MEWPYTGVLPSLPPTGNSFVEPTAITAGETLQFSRTCPQNPANGGWVLTYYLRGAGTEISFTSTPDGDLHKIVVPAATTLQWLPGKYAFQAQAAKQSTGVIQQVFQGFINIRANLSNVTGAQDLRSKWEVIRDNCLLVLQGRASSDVLNTTIGETTFSRMTPDQILVLHDRAQYNVNIEIENARAAQGMNTGRNILTTFVRTV